MSVDVWIFEVYAADRVDETLAADSRSVWPSEHVSGKGKRFAVFSPSDLMENEIPILGRKRESSPIAVLGG